MRYLAVIAMAVMLTTVAAAHEWKVAEIGGPDSEGSPYEGGEVDFENNGFTINSTGGDLWSNMLGITLVYVEISGDFIIQYTIEEHTSDPSAVWSKVGVMVMQDIEPDSPYVFVQSACSNNVIAANDKGTKIITRPVRGGEAGPGSNGWAPLDWPVTYKMIKEVDLFTVSVSLDGGKNFESVANPVEGKLDNSTLLLEDPYILGIAASGDEDGLAITTTATVVDIFIDGIDTFAVEPSGKLVTTWSALKTM